MTDFLAVIQPSKCQRTRPVAITAMIRLAYGFHDHTPHMGGVARATLAERSQHRRADGDGLAVHIGGRGLGANPGACDTPRVLKSGGFSRLATSPTSYSHYWLAGVPAATHNPQVVRDTMLDLGRRAQPAGLPGLVPRQDVDLPYHIAVRAETTPTAGIVPAAWFVSASTIWTGLGRVVLIDQLHRDAFGLGLVGDELAKVAVVPLGRLLVVLLPMIDAIRDIPHITNRDRASLLLDRRIHHRPTDLVLHIAHDALMPGAHAGPGSTQALVSPAALPLGAECLAQFRQAFGMTLLLVPPLATGDDRGLLLVAHNRGMDFAQIDRNNVRSRRHFRLFAVLDDEVPSVAVGAPVVDQSHFQHTQHVPEVLWQQDDDRRQRPRTRKQEGIPLAADTALLPDGRAPPRTLMWVLRAMLAIGPRRLARFVKAFLGRVLGVCVQQRWIVAREVVVQPHSGELRQPVARASAALAIDAVVSDECLGIDRAASPIERIGLSAIEMAVDDVCSDHGYGVAHVFQYVDYTALGSAAQGLKPPRSRLIRCR